MVVGVGWSASDIVLAVQVIHKVCTAFRKAGGADEQYVATVAFLDAFARTMQRIQAYIDSSTSPDFQGFSDDLTAQMRLIYTEYVKFDNYLKKVEPGLSSASFASRVAARTKWAIKEINQRVESLKKAVISPMMFVSPLLAVQTLKELQQLRAELPDASKQEAALRENRLLILRVNDNLQKLRDSLDSYWWSRRWALSAVEEDVKLLNSATKNNQDLVETSKSHVQDEAATEHAQKKQEVAVSNVRLISAVETVMESRLAQMEGKIDIMISEHRSATGRDDAELQLVKSRISNSRAHLRQAISSARQMLKHFGLLVKAVNSMHRNPLTQWMLPLANGLVGYDKIFEHGEKMVRNAGDTVAAGGKYVEETDLMKGLKSWNPFSAAVQGEKHRMAQNQNSSSSPHVAKTCSPTLSRATTVTNSEPDCGSSEDFGPFETASKLPERSFQNPRNVPSQKSASILQQQPTSRPTAPSLDPRATAKANLDLLLDFDGTDNFQVPQTATPVNSASKGESPSVSVLPLSHFEDNPWT